ncbi:PAS domain S-box protein [Tychonema sp. LEGE 07199]|uniref:PAS domain-containing sensor histidine kinase n=1 Tax=unclassified Tychonema TaxID=2642144 RepID=UPI001881E646|nr:MULTISPECIES: PAS domain S-box protein [unclassified Tychonema]MBE9121377.1 PAS domain S-box protein [Tychonema sp. LEGE 07199]MBE9133671.1 PAS domain S-box protein [Tychonema sp. LEGE 07196]
MPEIPVESTAQFQNSISELEQAESALKIAWDELEKQTAETIAQIAKADQANAQNIRERFAKAKQLRQQLQTKIKEANSRREFHLENSPLAVIEWDREGRVVRWSPVAEQIFGWSAAEVIGKYWHEWSIVYPEDFDLVSAVTNQLLQNKEPRTVCRNRNHTKDGSVIYCEWYNSALIDESGTLVSSLSFARDITEQHRTQEELHQREQEFSTLAENSTDIIARFDRQLRHLYVNQEIERATAKSPSEFIGKSNKELGISPDICNLWDEACIKVFRVGKQETIEFNFPTSDGTTYYQCRIIPEFAEDNSVETVLAIARDITEIKQVEAQLRQSEARFRRVVDSNMIGIIFWNINGEITDANQAFLNLVGYTRDDLFSKKIGWQTMTPPECRSLDEEKLAEVLANNTNTPFEKEYIRADGSRVPVLLGSALLEGSQELGVSFVLDVTERKQAELELQKQQELLESIIKTIPNFLYIYDTEAHQNIYANAAVTAMLGYSPQELQDLGTEAISSLVHPDDLPKLIVGMQRLENSTNPHETDDIDYRIKHKNGEWRWVHDRSTIFKETPEGKMKQVIGSVLDITDRKQAEESLKQQNELLQTIFENVPVMLAFLDSQGELTWVNRHWEQVLGWSFAETKNRDMLAEFYPEPKYRKYVFDFIQAATQKWGDFQTKVRDGRIIDTTWANVRLSDGRSIGIGQDISDRKRAEAELQQLNETLEAQVALRTAELETFFDSLPDLIFVVERENMRFSFVNWPFVEFCGFDSRQEMQGKTIYECYPSQLAEQFYLENMQVFVSGQTIHFQENFLVAGDAVYFDTFKIPLRNLDGEVYALIGTARNVTELIQTKQALSERTEQLEVANQELESFGYSVSHDLRAPLRHISGFVNALKQRLISTEVLNDPKIVHYIEIIEDSSQKMSLLIDGLLALSRVGRTDLIKIPIDLARLVQTAIKLSKPRTAIDPAENPDSKVEFTVGDLPGVMGDPTLLQQVFSNLIDNAVKFSRGRTPAIIVIDALPDGTIFVKDNGVGFSMEYADRLFGAFQRLHSQREFEGTGIGLAIVQRIIHRHGGTIWVQSVPSQGSTFYFKLGPTISNANLDS